MKRIGYLRRHSARGVTAIGHDMISPPKLLRKIRESVHKLIEERATCYEYEILPLLRETGIFFLTWDQLTPVEKKSAKAFFRTHVFPILTPLAVDPSHPFPFLSNLSVSLGLMVKHPRRGVPSFARIKIPNTLPQWIRLWDDSMRFIRLQDLIKHHLQEFFPKVSIEDVLAFRVTRNADVEYPEDDIEDILDVVEEELKMRHTAEVVRLETEPKPAENILRFLKEELDLSEECLFENQGELNFRTLDEISSLPLPQFKFRSWAPVTPHPFNKTRNNIFSRHFHQDLLLHHPYESFSGSVERFIRDAVKDPTVLAIKMTLYRTEKESPLISLLAEAAYSGKQVVCIVEPKARFDEAQNMQWGEMLEKAGVHVVYGMVGFKIHAKMVLVVRKENGDYRFYCHIGTGNYNAETAKHYTDLGLFTTDPMITTEVIQFFNYLTGFSLKQNYKTLLVSPFNLKQRMLELIEEEIDFAKCGFPSEMIAKMNSLEDQQICEALYRASQAGVDIHLIVRGICCLQPGIPGMSDNIRVRSIVGQFLEHSRLYYFRSGKQRIEQGKFFISSADWMFRNMHSRIEVAVPIHHDALKKECWDILQLYLADEYQSWELRENGQYQLIDPDLLNTAYAVQHRFINCAREKSLKKRSLYATKTSHRSSRDSRKKRDLRAFWKIGYLKASDSEGTKKNEKKRAGYLKDRQVR